jgi:hypothetical protein
VDATPRLTLATDGTPDSGTHTATHLGLTAGPITTTAKPGLVKITADQADAEVDAYASKMDMEVETELSQLSTPKLQRILGVGVYSIGGGYKQFTFGGIQTVPTICLAFISPRRAAPTKFAYSLLYNGASVGPLSFMFGRAKPATYKAKFKGASDLTRTAGQQIGLIIRQLLAPTGILPTAKDYTVGEIQQGPSNLYLIGTPPSDLAQRLTLSGDLTPDATAHPNSLGFGMTETGITMTLTPKIEEIGADQADGPVLFRCTALDVKLETTINQLGFDKLTCALGLTGAYSIEAGGTPSWEQIGFGGSTTVSQAAFAAIAPKRSDATKVWVGMIYKALSADGISFMQSRAKANTYKLTVTGVADLARTAGRQQGIIYETV